MHATRILAATALLLFAADARSETEGTAGAAGSTLRMPTASACLAEPDDTSVDEFDIFMGNGLTIEQVSDGMTAFTPELFRCVPAQASIHGSLQLTITVGCNGLVDTIEVENPDELPKDLVSCIEETLPYAAFPAHDMVGGVTFQYPMRFQFGPQTGLPTS